MLKFMHRLVLWFIILLTISTVTLFILYRITWIAVLLLIGGMIGIPFVWLIRSQFRLYKRRYDLD